MNENEKASAISPWAPRQDIRELSERLLAMTTGAQRLTSSEALALAQAAVAHGLDPFNGELWFLKDRGGRPLGLMAGIKGHRRSAHRQMREDGGGNYWPEFEQLGVDEKVALGIPEGALAYRCKIRDTQTVNHYVNEIERLLAAGLPWEAVQEIAGGKPYTEGIGYAEKHERSKMTLVQRAMKRAEADALKRRFDLPFGVAVGTAGDTDVIEGEFVADGEAIPQEVVEKAARDDPGIPNERSLRRARLDLAKGREILHGTETEQEWDAPSEKRTFDPAIIQAVIEAGLTENTFSFTDTMRKSSLPADAGRVTVLGWFRQYRNAGADSDEAAVVANAWWEGERPLYEAMHYTTDSGKVLGKLSPDELLVMVEKIDGLPAPTDKMKEIRGHCARLIDYLAQSE